VSNIIVLKENQKARIEVERKDGFLEIAVNETKIKSEDREAVIVIADELSPEVSETIDGLMN
jgi:hypothetical protein